MEWQLANCGSGGNSSRELYKCTDAQRANQRAPHSGLQLKRFYEGHPVHSVWPRGAMVSSVRVLGTCARRLEWSGAVGTQAGRSGWAKRNSTRGRVRLTEYLSTREALYILRRTRRPRGTYESGTRLCATAGRLGARPSDASGLRSRCQNVGIALRFALDLRPNIAGIGTLHQDVVCHTH